METRVDWGAFFYGRSAPSCFTSNQILQVRPNGDARDARGKSPFDGRFRIGRCCAALSRRRQFRVKNGLLRFENLTCTTTDRCHLSAAALILIEEKPFAAY